MDFNTTDKIAVGGGAGLISSLVRTEVAAASADADAVNAYNALLFDAISTATVLTAEQATTLNGLANVSKTTYAAGENPVAADCILYNAALPGHATVSQIIPAVVADISGAGALTVAKSYAKGIKINDTYAPLTDAAKFANNNYIITFNTAALTVVGATDFIIDEEDADLVNKLVVAHAAATPQVIKFTGRELKKEQWNVMVLPFDVNMTELCTAFGEYVVADVLTNTTDGNAHFKINLGTIKANTPFLLMPANNKNLNTVPFTKIVKYETETTADEYVTLDEAGNPFILTDGGVKFVGVYKTQNFTYATGNGIKYMSSGKFFNVGSGYDGSTPAKTLTLKATRAYLDLSGVSNARPMIYIENPDGSTTAISAVENDNVVESYTKDGWYTVNGVKLNDMPTVKGIYIHNGKKIVIK